MTRAEVLGMARQYAASDFLQCSIDATDYGPRSDADLIIDYLADLNPYPDQTPVEVIDLASGRWEPAVIIERAWPNEWGIDFDDSILGTKLADHTEIRFPAIEDGLVARRRRS